MTRTKKGSELKKGGDGDGIKLGKSSHKSQATRKIVHCLLQKYNNNMLAN